LSKLTHHWQQLQEIRVERSGQPNTVVITVGWDCSEFERYPSGSNQ